MQRNLNTCIPDDLRPLVGGFLARRSKDVQGLEFSLNTGDLQAVGGIAHKLKGNGTGYGFPAISEVGAELEMAAILGDEDLARALTAEFKEIIGYFQQQHLA